MLQRIKWLFLAELRIDWRNRYPFTALLLYAVVVVIVSYYAFSGYIKATAWNALFWLIILFISINAVAKSFIREKDRSAYYFFVVKPEEIIIAKLIYYGAYQLFVIAITLTVFTFLLGWPVKTQLPFFLNLLIGSFGLSTAFTMVSAIASKTNNNAVMMAILGFPIIVPMLLLAISNSEILILGGSLTDISTNLITLLSVNVIIIATAFILFPFTWKS